MKTHQKILENKIRKAILLFMVLLVLSGLTAFPVQTELNFFAGHWNWFPQFMQPWLMEINGTINAIAKEHSYLLYGYDWLAYSHIVIALFFIGVFRDPVRNAWVLRMGMLACAGVFIVAFIAGQVRGIPVFWTLIDCSFGFFGMIPLVLVQRWINQLEQLQTLEFTNKHHAL